MASRRNKVAVIGGGCAGIVSVASLLEEGVSEVVCFEKTDSPGGIWYYREESAEGVPAVMLSSVTNHSKEMGSFSNFPPRKESNNYMYPREMFEYFMDFAEAKGVLKHFRYNAEVILVKKSEDYTVTGRWVVTARDVLTGASTTEVFDGVMVCVGHMTTCHLPVYRGQDKFKGQIIHSHALKRGSVFQGKDVVVVGTGCSGLDAAVECSDFARQVYLSTRSGAHVMNRVGLRGFPVDYIMQRRYILAFMDATPYHHSIMSSILESSFTSTYFDPRLCVVPPDHRVLSKRPVLNDYIAAKIISGSVVQARDIEHFEEDGVVFEGDAEVTKADAIVMATGYNWGFPFLEDGVVVKDRGMFNLYKNIFPAHLQSGTLAIIGLYMPFGPGYPIGELQARWAVQVMVGNRDLPSPEDMTGDIRKKYALNVSRYQPTDKLALYVEFIAYCDELAAQFGAKPNLWKMFFTDFPLFRALVFGPHLCYQYRLQGPHAWPGAREAIVTVEERVVYPMNKTGKFENLSVLEYIQRRWFEVWFSLLY